MISRAALKGIDDPRVRKAFEEVYNTLDNLQTRFGKAISEEGVISAHLPAGIHVLGDLILDGGLAVPVAAKTANYTATKEDYVILCDASGGAFTVTLPVGLVEPGRSYHIKKTDSSANAVTIDAAGSETIDGDLTVGISAQYESLLLISDGSNWHVH